jgi:hypothetical protein
MKTLRRFMAAKEHFWPNKPSCKRIGVLVLLLSVVLQMFIGIVQSITDDINSRYEKLSMEEFYFLQNHNLDVNRQDAINNSKRQLLLIQLIRRIPGLKMSKEERESVKGYSEGIKRAEDRLLKMNHMRAEMEMTTQLGNPEKNKSEYIKEKTQKLRMIAFERGRTKKNELVDLSEVRPIYSAIAEQLMTTNAIMILLGTILVAL